MKSWSFLKPGDLIDVIAPGSATTKDELKAAIRFLHSWGLKHRVREPLFSGHPFVSDTVENRVKDLKAALFAKDSKAVWCLRGGYGSIQMVSELLKIKVPSTARPKLLIGYSDITTIHLWMNQVLRWPTCHGPLLDSMARNKYFEKDTREFSNLLFGVQSEITFDGLVPLNKKAIQLRSLEASLVAGNLVVLASSLGSKVELKTKGKILCLEEIGERGYRVDRLLWQLQNSKALDGCEAILLGNFIGGNEPKMNPDDVKDQTKNFIETALQEFAERTKVPVLSGLQMGHGDVNRPLFLGSKAQLKRTHRESHAGMTVFSGGHR